MFWRKKRKPPVSLPEPPELPAGRAKLEDVPYWMARLARRLARLRRFRELRAPENIVEEERRLVREAIATLTPREALSVIHWSPQFVHHVDQDGPRRESEGGTSRKPLGEPN
jgi:DNA-directed RNA polymerase beta' subunit